MPYSDKSNSVTLPSWSVFVPETTIALSDKGSGSVTKSKTILFGMSSNLNTNCTLVIESFAGFGNPYPSGLEIASYSPVESYKAKNEASEASLTHILGAKLICRICLCVWQMQI